MAPTYEKVIADIIERCSFVDENTVKLCEEENALVYRTLDELLSQRGGWILMTLLTITFTECRRLIAHAQGKDKELLTEMVKATIGSFGSSVQ